MPIHISLRRYRRTHDPIRKEDGCTVTAVGVYLVPFRTQKSSPACVSPITVVRESTGKEVTVPLSLSPRIYPRNPRRRALKAGSPPWRAGLFCVLQPSPFDATHTEGEYTHANRHR